MTQLSRSEKVRKGRRRIVVGVDGSAVARSALRWAVAEAAVRGSPLLVVHSRFARRELLDLYPDLSGGEERVLEEAVGAARAAAPTVEVSGLLAEPPAAEALVEASEGAELLVVGSRGSSGLRRMVLGSVSDECVRRGRCPVVVVRSTGGGGSEAAALKESVEATAPTTG